MRKHIEIVIIIIIAMISGFGCSSNPQTGVIPTDQSYESTGLPISANITDNSRIFWGAWSATFDLEKNTVSIIPDRELAMHFNVKPWIPTPGIHINGYDPSTHVIDVDVTLSNPYPITGYDVRLIIYTDNIGHELLNADDWTSLYDISGGFPINPFMAYMKGDPNRKFSGPANHTENLQILLPGGNPNVKFAVDASYPGNCEEPYTMGQFVHAPLGPNIGDSAPASITVADWQNNTSSVNLFCPSVCGAGLVFFSYTAGDEWDGVITNNKGASFGTYPGFFIASSSNSGTLYLYDKVTITVSSGNNAPICDAIDTDPESGIIGLGETISFYISAHDPDGDSLTYQWDLDWNGNPADFNVDGVGAAIEDYHWLDQGFYEVACRITDDGTPSMSTICSRICIQEGESQNQIKIDDSLEDNPGYLDSDTLILGESYGKPISHVAYRDFNDNLIYYCNNAGHHDSFGNHTIISTGPLNGSNFGVKIIGAENMIYVFWFEYDTSDMTAYCRIKVKKSHDFGQNFSDEFLVAQAPDPNLILSADVCVLTNPQHLGLIYTFRISVNMSYYIYLITSDDGGESWDSPPNGSGQFRSASLGNVTDPQLAFSSANQVIHTFWKDYRATPPDYYYDWSTNFGDNWHTDIKISDQDDVVYAAIAVADNGNGYFVWVDNATSQASIRKSQFGDPPTFDTAEIWFDTGSGIFNGIDLWVSPSGETLIVPMTYVLSDNYKNRYFFSYDSGTTFEGYFERAFGAIEIYDIDSAVLLTTGPGPERMEIVSSWVEYSSSKAPPSDHIYGDFVYLAEK